MEISIHTTLKKVIGEAKSRVLANGSIGGVDLNKFKPQPTIRAALRSSHGYADTHVVYMYLGRLTGEKGLQELAVAFDALAAAHPEQWQTFGKFFVE